MSATEEIAARSIYPCAEAPYGRFRQLALRLFFFPLAYLIFAIGALSSSLVAMPLSFILPERVGRPAGQRLIHWLFAFFVWYLETTGLIVFDFRNTADLRRLRGGIIVANHPCLLDAVFLISKFPRVFCLSKAGLLSNLFLCGTARLAGYVDNRSHRQMVEACVRRLRAGETLLVFPEGTRTMAPGVNGFKMGFVLIAQLASAPIQTVFIKTESPYLGKQWPFLAAPSSFPLRYTIVPGRQFTPDPDSNPKVQGKIIEDYFQDILSASGSRTRASP
jgi:1-acyl-sn-glycerol-3-phosphate acyltransferase